MKFIKKYSTLISVIALLLIIFTSTSYSQRCGDGILFSFTDGQNSLIESTKLSVSGDYNDSYYWDNDAVVKPGMKLKYPEFYQVQKDTIYISKLDRHVEWKDGSRFYVRTFCSMLLMSVKVTYESKIMQLDIYNIPGDIPLKIENIPFTEGKFDVNLNGYIDYKNFTRDSGGSYLLGFDRFKTAE